MAKCISCGAENSAGEKFCSECGMRLPVETAGAMPGMAAAAGANAEKLEAYKVEASAILKAGTLNLMSKRRLKMLQKQFGLTDAQAQDAEKEILADIERERAEAAARQAEEEERKRQEEQARRQAEEEARREAERQARESEASEEDGSADADGVTYQDVFERVCEYLQNNGGYDPSVDKRDGSVSMTMDDDGFEHMYWDSVEEFLTAPMEGHHANFDESGCAGIFAIADLWYCKYDRLTRWAAAFMDNCGDLRKVDVSDTSPSGLMEALDDSGIDDETSDDSNSDSEEDDVCVDEDTLDTNEDDAEEDDETETSSSSERCSIVVNGFSGKYLDNLIIALNDFDELPVSYDTRQMITNPPGTLAKNITREKAEQIAAVLKKYSCDFEIIVKEKEEGEIDFDAISDYIASFKKSVGCDDIVLPGASSFDKKWSNLSTVLENSFDDLSLDPDDAIAILDCTVFGSAKNGVLIDKTGIYTNSDHSDLNGWCGWESFIADGRIEKIGSYDVHLWDDPDGGVNVAGCNLSQANTIRFFKGLLALVRGEEA